MLKGHAGRENAIGQDSHHQKKTKGGRVENRKEEEHSPVLLARCVYGDKFPAAVVSADDPGVRHIGQLGTARSPHGLELNSNFVESLGDDSNEDVLDEPREEENHGGEVDESSPGWKCVHRSVHDENPSFLRKGLVDREDTCRC